MDLTSMILNIGYLGGDPQFNIPDEGSALDEKLNFDMTWSTSYNDLQID